MAEIFDILAVRDEFLRNIYEQYLQIYSEKQAMISIELLTEFCTNVKNNNLALVRITPEQLQSNGQPQVVPSEDPFQAEHIKREVDELNQNMKIQPPSRAPPSDEIDLGTDKKRTFVDKVRDMRTFKKDPNRINPED